MKIATYNVNSIRMRLDVIVAWLGTHQPDVLAVQETKVEDAAFPAAAIREAGWHVAFHGQKTYNGVCLISKAPATNIRMGLDDGEPDGQARLIVGEFGDVTVVNTYVPQGNEVGSDRFKYKLRWLARLRKYFEKHFKPEQPLAWVGDFNIAPEDMDVYAPDFFENDVGCNADERAALEALRAWGFVDVFRALHPGEKKRYTFFDYRVKDSVKYRKGWRIDHIFATAPLAARIKACDIDMEPRLLEKASDHTFVWAEFEA